MGGGGLRLVEDLLRNFFLGYGRVPLADFWYFCDTFVTSSHKYEKRLLFPIARFSVTVSCFYLIKQKHSHCNPISQLVAFEFTELIPDQNTNNARHIIYGKMTQVSDKQITQFQQR